MIKFNAGNATDIPPGSMKVVNIEDTPILIVNVNGIFYAVENKCSHREAPLNEGLLEGTNLICPHHAAQFDLKTGKPTFMMSIPNLKVFSVEVEGDNVIVQI